MNRITWKKDTRQYSNGEFGYRNKIECFYLNHWAVYYDEDNKNTILLNSYLPSIKSRYRCKAIEPAKRLAEALLEEFIEGIK